MMAEREAEQPPPIWQDVDHHGPLAGFGPPEDEPDSDEAAQWERQQQRDRKFKQRVRDEVDLTLAKRRAREIVDGEDAVARARLAGRKMVNWAHLLAADFNATQFVTRPLLQPGAQISLVASGKEGKSLFCWEWACRLANGLPFLGNPEQEPLVVGYFDYENPHSELQRRARTTGFDEPKLLDNLRYESFPDFGPLDTPVGAATAIAWVDEHAPQVVFLDTVSRVIAGKENDADTWLQLYRLFILPMKARGVSLVRLDHFGKDRERGARGNSAKTQDIDAEWTMTRTPTGLLMLRRTYTRSGLGDGLLYLRRRGNPEEWGTTTHTLELTPNPAQEAAAGRLIGLARAIGEAVAAGKLPRNVGRERAREYFASTGDKIGNELLAEALRVYKAGEHFDVATSQTVDDGLPDTDPLFDLDPGTNT